jgi:tripartite-type tricarboxylate transporter receptor subunit TctC
MSDFIHLSQVHSGPNVLVVHPATPYKTVADVVDFAKKNPGKLDYGFTHAASGHMAMELFKQTAGIELTGIPYKGGGPMLIDLLAGVIPTMFINQDAALAHVRSGKMRAIAVSSVARNPLYPDVPTIAESGYKGFEALSWSGMSVAKGTPQAVVDKLEAAITQAMQSDTIRQRMNSVGFVVPPQGSKPYTAFVKSELDTWVRVIKTAGIKPE